MMWYLQLSIEWAGWLLAQDVAVNAIFACLALWAGFGESPRMCAVLTAVIYALLIML
jgi:hypothetical protein